MSIYSCTSLTDSSNWLNNSKHNEDTSPFPEETWLLIFQYAAYNSGTTYANMHLTCYKWHSILINSQTSPLVKVVNTIRPHLTKPRTYPFIDHLFFEFPNEKEDETKEIKVTLLWHQNAHTFYRLLPKPIIKVREQEVVENQVTQKIQCGLESLIQEAINYTQDIKNEPDALKKFPWQRVLADPTIPLTIKGN